MKENPTDLDQTKLGLAALAVAFARTLGESDETFPLRLEQQIEKVYRALEDYPVDTLPAQEVLLWTRNLLNETEA